VKVTRRTVVGVALSCSVSVLTAVPSAVRAAGDPAHCSVIATATGTPMPTLFCAGSLTNSSTSGLTSTITLFRSRDAGRTWRRVPAGGLATSPTPLSDLVVSSAFATDHTLYVQLGEAGVYVSTDEGASFQLTHPGSGRIGGTGGTNDATMAPPNLTPFTATSGLPAPVGAAVPYAAVAYAGEPSTVLTGGQALPVAGAPGRALTFLIPRSFASDHVAFALGQVVEPTDNSLRAALFSCDGTLSCPTVTSTFPRGLYPEGAAIVTEKGRPATIFVWFERDLGSFRTVAYVSRDAGRTFSPLAAVNQLLEQIYTPHTNAAAAWNLPTLGLASSARFPRTLYLRMSYGLPGALVTPGPAPPAPPGERVFRSDDLGASWRMVGFGLTAGQSGRKGGLPWNERAGFSPSNANILLLDDGRLLVAATAADGYTGPFCSVDGGRTWGRGCSR
jgi:hypothetical protein